jgi:probable addiction module antidote protein
MTGPPSVRRLGARQGDEGVIAEYLNVALASGHPDLSLLAIADVAKARGMAQQAKDTGLGRESLFKGLAPGAKPRYDTDLKLLRAGGVELQMTAIPRKPNDACCSRACSDARCARI